MKDKLVNNHDEEGEMWTKLVFINTRLFIFLFIKITCVQIWSTFPARHEEVLRTYHCDPFVILKGLKMVQSG